MEDTKYNGWSNRDTWGANILLKNSNSAYKKLLKCENEDQVWRVFLDKFGHEHDGISISEVNWYEIFEGIK